MIKRMNNMLTEVNILEKVIEDKDGEILQLRKEIARLQNIIKTNDVLAMQVEKGFITEDV